MLDTDPEGDCGNGGTSSEVDDNCWVAGSGNKAVGVELGKALDPIVEGGRGEFDVLPVVVDHGEEEGGFRGWKEFESPGVLTSSPFPASLGAMGCEVKRTELGACAG
jgi:hypothetical protein